MEIIDNIQTPLVTNTPSVQTKNSNTVKGILFVLASILLVAGGALGYKLYADKFISEDSTEEISCDNEETETITSTYAVTESTAYDDDERIKYLIFQVKYNSKYFATSDDMLMYYKSQGGSADPRLVLSTVTQPLGSVSYDKLLNQNEGSTIAIWSTIGFDNLDEWLYQRNITDSVTISEEKIVSGEYTFEKRIISSSAKDQNIIVAYLALPNDITYFLETNNTTSESDFDSILKSFDVRGDVE